MPHELPVLVACSHGTGSPAGRGAVGSLVAAVGRRRPDLEVRAAFVDVQPPSPARVMAGVATLAVPLVADVGVGANWDEAH